MKEEPETRIIWLLYGMIIAIVLICMSAAVATIIMSSEEDSFDRIETQEDPLNYKNENYEGREIRNIEDDTIYIRTRIQGTP